VRAIPNCLFVRPADGNECNATWDIAIRNRSRPTVRVCVLVCVCDLHTLTPRAQVMALSRQTTPQLNGSSYDGVFKGAYVISQPADGKPKVRVWRTCCLCAYNAGDRVCCVRRSCSSAPGPSSRCASTPPSKCRARR
jgi:hypothetical protein